MKIESQNLTIKNILKNAYNHIPYNEARLLLQNILKVNHAHIITHPSHMPPLDKIRRFQLQVKRRATGEPIAYILGECEFYSIKFKITPSVLIPRPETELLVEMALEKISSDIPCKILDLGTGSGVIAIAIAKHRDLSNITAVESSENAIAVARKNILDLNINNVHIVKSNWFKNLPKEQFDLIVSNPPYIAKDDPHLNQGDLRFEPKSALIAGQNGVDCIQTIISSATSYLNSHGWLILEHGYNQAKVCTHLLKEAGFKNVFSCPDLSGIMRISGGRYKTSLKKTARIM